MCVIDLLIDFIDYSIDLFVQALCEFDNHVIYIREVLTKGNSLLMKLNPGFKGSVCEGRKRRGIDRK